MRGASQHQCLGASRSVQLLLQHDSCLRLRPSRTTCSDSCIKYASVESITSVERSWKVQLMVLIVCYSAKPHICKYVSVPSQTLQSGGLRRPRDVFGGAKKSLDAIPVLLYWQQWSGVGVRRPEWERGSESYSQSGCV